MKGMKRMKDYTENSLRTDEIFQIIHNNEG